MATPTSTSTAPSSSSQSPPAISPAPPYSSGKRRSDSSPAENGNTVSDAGCSVKEDVSDTTHTVSDLAHNVASRARDISQAARELSYRAHELPFTVVMNNSQSSSSSHLDDMEENMPGPSLAPSRTALRTLQHIKLTLGVLQLCLFLAVLILIDFGVEPFSSSVALSTVLLTIGSFSVLVLLEAGLQAIAFRDLNRKKETTIKTNTGTTTTTTTAAGAGVGATSTATFFGMRPDTFRVVMEIALPYFGGAIALVNFLFVSRGANAGGNHSTC